MIYGCFVFFKQKTAYERRISDWSSDVCSSDLPVEGHQIGLALVAEAGQVAQSRVELVPGGDAAGVERLQEAGLAPLQDALRTGVGEVGLEAGAPLLESLLLIAEEGEGRRVAVLVGIALVERGVFVAGPVDHGNPRNRCQSGRT